MEETQQVSGFSTHIRDVLRPGEIISDYYTKISLCCLSLFNVNTIGLDGEGWLMMLSQNLVLLVFNLRSCSSTQSAMSKNVAA